MTALLVVLMFVGFVALDFVVRTLRDRAAEARARKQREAVLHASLRLEFDDEAKSLKRVIVPGAKARVLAVDDEPVVLDSFRKILVIAGYSVDTVESGPEALGLVRRIDYDFVFTDLKMPEMDGVEVVKAVRHLRPDVDVAVITGYATIETAVETMQHGAVDYVQKPFTEDELIAFAERLLLKRQARLEALRKPAVRIAAPARAEFEAVHEYCVPGGAFLSDGHAWARLEPGGLVKAGADDFVRKAVGSLDAVELPAKGAAVRKGEPLFTLRHGPQAARVCSPVTGKVTEVNEALLKDPARLLRSPYDLGWVCTLAPSELASEIKELRIGQPVVAWYQDEIARLRKSGPTPVTDWAAFEAGFLHASVLAQA